MTPDTALLCICGHAATDHRGACRMCRGRAWPCKFYVSRDVIVVPASVPTAEDDPASRDLFRKERAA